MCTSCFESDGGQLSLLSQVFRRAVGGGWLIVSGPTPSIGDDSVERLLEVVDLSRPILVIRPQDAILLEIDQWVLDLEALLEIPLTYLELDVVDDHELITQCQEAGLVIIAAEDDFPLASLIKRIASNQSEFALDRNQILWFVGTAGMTLGDWAYNVTTDQTIEGMGWLPGAVILHQMGGLAEMEPVQEILRNHHRSYALNLLGDATIALGPEGEIELWGSPQPSIVLGHGWGEA